MDLQENLEQEVHLDLLEKKDLWDLLVSLDLLVPKVKMEM